MSRHVSLFVMSQITPQPQQHLWVEGFAVD